MLLNACFSGHDDGETANFFCDRPGQDTSVLYLKSSTKTIGQRRCCVSAKQKKVTGRLKGRPQGDTAKTGVTEREMAARPSTRRAYAVR